jgi:large repetitive protein
VVSYTVTATNTGENPATGLVVHDALPAGRLTFVSASADTGSYDAITGDWTIGTLTVGPVATLTLVARVIDSGKIDNTAAVSAMLQRDTNPANNSATVQIDAPPAADLSLTKTVDNDTPDKGSTVVFTVTVTNSGPNDTAGVVVTDALPAGLTYVSDDGGTVGPDPAYDPATGHWTVGGLNVGAHATLHITATVDVGETRIVNTAEVTHSDLPDPDSTPGNGVEGEDDQAVAMLNARGVADLAIKKTASPAKVIKGGQTTYTLTLTNKGPQDATGVIVRDQLPSSVTFVSSSGGTYDSRTGVWTVGSLANGDSATLKIVVKVGKTGSIVNVTNVVASDQRDPDASNGQATAGVAAAGPTPATTAAGDQGPLPRDPGALALWLLAIAFAGIALLGLAALASKNRRPWMRR